MAFPQIIFYTFAALAVVSALLILFTPNVLYAAFLLIVTFLCVSAVYVFAGADFVAITQILVYVGGMLVLIIFGVMLTNRLSGKAVTTSGHYYIWGSLIGGATFSILCYTILQVNFASLTWMRNALDEGQIITGSTVNTLGIQMMTDFVLPFELTGILLLLGLIGAAFISRRQLD